MKKETLVSHYAYLAHNIVELKQRDAIQFRILWLSLQACFQTKPLLKLPLHKWNDVLMNKLNEVFCWLLIYDKNIFFFVVSTI